MRMEKHNPSQVQKATAKRITHIYTFIEWYIPQASFRNFWVYKQGPFQLSPRYSSCFNSTQILSSSNLGQEVKAIARSSNCQEEFSWPENNSWNIIRIHGQTSLFFPKIFNSTSCQNFRFSTTSWCQSTILVPFCRGCMFSMADSEGRVAFTESSAPFPSASCVSAGSIPSRHTSQAPPFWSSQDLMRS